MVDGAQLDDALAKRLGCDAEQHVHQVILTSGPAMHVSGTAGPLGLD